MNTTINEIPAESFDQLVSKEQRREQLTETMDPTELEQYISQLVYNAYLAGANGYSRIGRVPGLAENERQAKEYCRDKGLTPP